MAIIEYRGHKITPASYENSYMPGYWFPLAIVDSPTEEGKRVVLQPSRGIRQADADIAAIYEAKRRIASNDL